ncbi:hypothetical protein EP56_01600 [Listeriaceae bacterium FSL A5-0209]|nr:hypothetical protein EP56_01600 [Listeriaceae bacterium FSL A5-0209]
MIDMSRASSGDFREGDIIAVYYNGGCCADISFLQASIVERKGELVAVHNRLDLAMRYDFTGGVFADDVDSPVFIDIHWILATGDKITLLFRSKEACDSK